MGPVPVPVKVAPVMLARLSGCGDLHGVLDIFVSISLFLPFSIDVPCLFFAPTCRHNLLFATSDMTQRCAFLGMLVGAVAQGPEDGYSRDQLRPSTNFRLCCFSSKVFAFIRVSQAAAQADNCLDFELHSNSNTRQTGSPQCVPQSRLMQDSLSLRDLVHLIFANQEPVAPAWPGFTECENSKD